MSGRVSFRSVCLSCGQLVEDGGSIEWTDAIRDCHLGRIRDCQRSCGHGCTGDFQGVLPLEASHTFRRAVSDRRDE